MRIAIGQLWQETNTFNPWPTTRADFETFGIHRGQAILDELAETNEIGGFIQSLQQWREMPDIVGLVRLPAWPAGTATAETFDWIRHEFTQAMQQALPVDGVLLALHGAMVAEGHPDVEGDILQALREIIGPDVPLVATLDLHANITERMVRTADVLVPYHTVPHIDVVETGERAAAVLRRILVNGAQPAVAFKKLPLVVPAQLANTQDPESVSFAFKNQLVELESQPTMLVAGMATVQPWLDIPELGGAVVVTADRDSQAAQAACSSLADDLWQSREKYLPELTPVADAVRDAYELATESAGSFPVVLSDGADATTSGAPGDSNWILKELVKYQWPRPALVTLTAPDVVAAARKRGVGATILAPLGGKLDHRFSQPMEITTRIVRLFQAQFILSGHLGKNMPIDMGDSVVLEHNNVHIVATTRSGPHFAPELFQLAGLDPFQADVVVAKSPCGFRAAYQQRSRKVILVQAPGCAPADFWQYEYKQIPRSLWPWDNIEKWQS